MSEDTKSIVKAGLEKASSDLSLRLVGLGFEATKKWHWVRLKTDSADFVHLHRNGSSYGGYSRGSGQPHSHESAVGLWVLPTILS